MLIRHRYTALAATAIFLLAAHSEVKAVEEAEYITTLTDGDIELREYEPSIVAETSVESDFEDASNKAFRILFRYIDGENEARGKIAMTAPVSQEQNSQKIAMTAPVAQQQSANEWVVSFMMPSTFTMETIPVPTNPAVKLRALPAWRAAAIRYSGVWSEKNYKQHLDQLRNWMDARNLEAAGPPVWARYNAPFVPWFMRRNEILIPIDSE